MKLKGLALLLLVLLFLPSLSWAGGMSLQSVYQGTMQAFNRGGVVSHVAVDLVSPVVIVLAFVTAGGRILKSVVERGVEGGKETVKKEMSPIFAVLLVCLPIWGGSNLLMAYPSFVATTGLAFGDEVARSLPANTGTVSAPTVDCASYKPNSQFTATLKPGTGPSGVGMVGLSQGASAYVSAVEKSAEAETEALSKCAETANKSYEPNALERVEIFIILLGLIVILLMLAWPVLIAQLPAFPVTAGAWYTALYSLATFIKTHQLIMMTLSSGAFLLIARLCASILFIWSIQMCFWGVMITWIVKVVIFSVTFSISAINLCFERRKDNFTQGIFKGLALLITPAIACITFSVGLTVFAMINGGLIETIRDSVIGTLPAWKDASVGTYAWSYLTYPFKYLLFSAVYPFILTLPIARIMLTSFQIAEEAIGGVQTGMGSFSIGDKAIKH